MTTTDIDAVSGEYITLAQPLEADVRQRINYFTLRGVTLRHFERLLSRGSVIAEAPADFAQAKIEVLEKTTDQIEWGNARITSMSGALNEATFHEWTRIALYPGKHRPQYVIFAGEKMLDDIERNFRGLDCGMHPGDPSIRVYSGCIMGREICIIGPLRTVPNALMAVDRSTLDPKSEISL